MSPQERSTGSWQTRRSPFPSDRLSLGRDWINTETHPQIYWGGEDSGAAMETIPGQAIFHEGTPAQPMSWNPKLAAKTTTAIMDPEQSQETCAHVYTGTGYVGKMCLTVCLNVRGNVNPAGRYLGQIWFVNADHSVGCSLILLQKQKVSIAKDNMFQQRVQVRQSLYIIPTTQLSGSRWFIIKQIGS